MSPSFIPELSDVPLQRVSNVLGVLGGRDLKSYVLSAEFFLLAHVFALAWNRKCSRSSMQASLSALVSFLSCHFVLQLMRRFLQPM
jgi:hypothetical protein